MNRMAEFLRRERQALVGYVRRRIAAAAELDAEDIVQDVMLGLLDRADPTVPIRDLAAYIYRALSNRITDAYRGRRETAELTAESVAAAPSDDPLRAAETREMVDAAFAALDELSPQERAVVLATELEGRAFKDLAEEWDVPLGTLLARKSRALEKLRSRLSGRAGAAGKQEKQKGA